MTSVFLKASGDDRAMEIKWHRGRSEPRDVFTFEHGGRREDVEITGVPDDHGFLHRQGRVVPFHVFREGRMIHVWMEGRTHVLEVADGAPRAATVAGAPTATLLAAPMPGTVLDIRVKAGEAFEAHQPLIILESMKMEMTLSAPHPGRVREILCEQGRLVDLGAVLATIDPLEPT